jgi:hypothetical protein
MEISGKLKLQQISNQSIFTDEAIGMTTRYGICNGSYNNITAIKEISNSKLQGSLWT